MGFLFFSATSLPSSDPRMRCSWPGPLQPGCLSCDACFFFRSFFLHIHRLHLWSSCSSPCGLGVVPRMAWGWFPCNKKQKGALDVFDPSHPRRNSLSLSLFLGVWVGRSTSTATTCRRSTQPIEGKREGGRRGCDGIYDTSKKISSRGEEKVSMGQEGRRKPEGHVHGVAPRTSTKHVELNA